MSRHSIRCSAHSESSSRGLLAKEIEPHEDEEAPSRVVSVNG